VEAEIDEDVKATMVADGMDELLASHLAHLFCRDPLVIFEEHIEIDDATRTDHFENIQSTNWNSVRWKPPPPRTNGDPHIGWRTEFRSMETQITDYENAAMTVFVVLLSRVLLSFDLNLYIPISKVSAMSFDACVRAFVRVRVYVHVPLWRDRSAHRVSGSNVVSR
jgi:glutamate--cysteine ligase catalytic subunit